MALKEKDPMEMWRNSSTEDDVGTRGTPTSRSLGRLLKLHSLPSVIYHWPLKRQQNMATAGTVLSVVAPPLAGVWLGKKFKIRFLTSGSASNFAIIFLSVVVCGASSLALHYAAVLRPLATRLQDSLPRAVALQVGISSLFGALVPGLAFPLLFGYIWAAEEAYRVGLRDSVRHIRKLSKPVLMKQGSLALLVCSSTALAGVWLQNRAFSKMSDALNADPEFYDDINDIITVESKISYVRRFLRWIMI